MSDDIIKRLREAIAAGPTVGPWTMLPAGAGEQCVARINSWEAVPPNGVELAHDSIDANYIAAASPDNIAALLDRLDAAEAENERLRMELAYEEQRVADMMADVNRVGHENEALREDARRYRWLRGDSCPDHSIRWTQWDVRCWVAPFWSDDLRRERLDRSIDAAMAADQPSDRREK